MSFLSSFFLIALPLIGVPIALHFYKGRQVDVIEWGAMHFLIDAVSDGRRWEKLEEILLMLLRVAAVAALVLALAQPMVRGSWLGIHDRREVVLVIDDSLSTAVESGDQTVFQQIQKEATSALSNLTSEDRVNVIAASGGGRWVTLEAIAATTSGKRRLTETIESLKPTQGAANLLDCLRAIEGGEQDDQITERLVLVFTDGQAQAFALVEDNPTAAVTASESNTAQLGPEKATTGQEAWRAWAAVQQSSDTPLTVRIVECGLGDAAPANLAVAAPTASRTVIRKGDEITLTCEVGNFGDEPTKPTTLEWRLSNKANDSDDASDAVLVKANVPAIAPGEIAQPVAKTRLTGSGPQLLECSLTTEDNLPLDQSAALVVEISDQLPVLIVESTSAGDSSSDRELDIDATEHLTAALGYLDGEPQPWRSVYKPDVIAPSELANIDLGDYRAVLLTDLAGLDSSDVDRLRGFVAIGGGLWATLGGSIEADAFNALWYDDGEGLCPLALDDQYGSGRNEDWSVTSTAVDERKMETESGEATIHPPEGDHPATKQLANTTGLDIDKTLLTRHWRFQKLTQASSTEASESQESGSLQQATSVLLRSDAGTPLAIERFYGRGRVIMQAFPLDLAWSNLPVRKAYVVMVHDWLDYLASPTQGRYNLAPGTPIVAQAPSEGQAGNAPIAAKITPPGGEAIDLAPRGDLSDGVYRYTGTTLPGVYRVAFRAGGEEIAEAVYQSPRRLDESRLDRIDSESRKWLAESAGIAFDAGESVPVTASATVSPPAPFWWTLLAALAALLVLELLLATRISWRRMGEPVAA